MGGGSSLLRLGKADAAIMAFSSALRIRPDDASLHALLGDAHALAGDVEDAAGAYKQALSLSSNHKRARAGLARVRPVLNRKAADAWRAKAQKHFRAKQYQIAATAYEKASEGNPNDPRAFAGLGASRLALSDAGASIEAYRRAIELAPDHAGHWAQLGIAQQKLGHLKKASKSYRRALSINATHSIAKERLASLQPKAGKGSAKPAAIDELAAALLDDPLNEKKSRRGITNEMPTLPGESDPAEAETGKKNTEDGVNKEPTPEPDVKPKKDAPLKDAPLERCNRASSGADTFGHHGGTSPFA